MRCTAEDYIPSCPRWGHLAGYLSYKLHPAWKWPHITNATLTHSNGLHQQCTHLTHPPCLQDGEKRSSSGCIFCRWRLLLAIQKRSDLSQGFRHPKTYNQVTSTVRGWKIKVSTAALSPHTKVYQQLTPGAGAGEVGSGGAGEGPTVAISLVSPLHYYSLCLEKLNISFTMFASDAK